MHVVGNYETRIALLEERGESEDTKRAAALRHHQKTKLDELQDEIENQIKVDRLKRIVRGLRKVAKPALKVAGKLARGS